MSDVHSILADNEVMVTSLRDELDNARRENGTSVCIVCICESNETHLLWMPMGSHFRVDLYYKIYCNNGTF